MKADIASMSAICLKTTISFYFRGWFNHLDITLIEEPSKIQNCASHFSCLHVSIHKRHYTAYIAMKIKVYIKSQKLSVYLNSKKPISYFTDYQFSSRHVLPNLQCSDLPTAAMAGQLNSFLQKFYSIWQAGNGGRLNVECHAGKTQIHLQFNLHLQHCKK